LLAKLFRFFRPATASPDSNQEKEDVYRAKIQQELGHFNEVTDVHALPPIYFYWFNKHLAPMLRDCGLSGIDEFFAKFLFDAAQRAGIPLRFVSIGSGNCDTEIRVAKILLEMGLKQFAFECLEVNPGMLERGRVDAVDNGIAQFFVFTEADFNSWSPMEQYSAVMANHSLHHVVNLEGLFDRVKSSLHPQGYFVANDMIGRNGHQRWPEALTHVQEFWKELPDAYRYNHLLQRHEPEFVNWDCSNVGFEGIRTQDILPLLIERFDFPLFIGFANVIAPFIDRCFGHNFDVTSANDQALIDRIHAVDENGFLTGELTPTQMLAVMSPSKAETYIHSRGLTPQMSVRRPD
jgi:SAM-dependent methyltransferase